MTWDEEFAKMLENTGSSRLPVAGFNVRGIEVAPDRNPARFSAVP